MSQSPAALQGLTPILRDLEGQLRAWRGRSRRRPLPSGTDAASGSFADGAGTSWTATVDYGDSSGVQPLALNANRTFNLSHFYADSGNYAVTVVVTNNLGTVGTH